VANERGRTPDEGRKRGAVTDLHRDAPDGRDRVLGQPELSGDLA
jgi:hypothetical protein